MDNAPRARRRWFQFSLGTLWLILTVALAFYGISEHRRRVQAERATQVSLDVVNRAAMLLGDASKMEEDTNHLLREMEELERTTNDELARITNDPPPAR